uniref:Uncharacterized protein n=1 Tax=Picea glauca TaxID=3330 RepID=A0A101M0D9_PICGL|nr:hypothetical protein ABT39_MTgene4724 [Picea glauca]QHR91301.1 hypothetical protein Q903MT_gene5333 [Picea sitchensis]
MRSASGQPFHLPSVHSAFSLTHSCPQQNKQHNKAHCHSLVPSRSPPQSISSTPCLIQQLARVPEHRNIVSMDYNIQHLHPALHSSLWTDSLISSSFSHTYKHLSFLWFHS